MFERRWSDPADETDEPKRKAPRNPRDPLTPLLIAVLAHRGEPVTVSKSDNPADVLQMLRDFERTALARKDLDYAMWAQDQIVRVMKARP